MGIFLKIKSILFYFGFIITYLQLPLALGPMRIPLFFLLCLLPVTFILSPESFSVKDLKFVFLLLIFTNIFSFLANYGILAETIKGSFQLTISFIWGLVLFRVLTGFKREKAYTIIKNLLIWFIVLAILEVIGVTRPISDWFRSNAGYEFLYQNDWRDELYSGHIRPKVFSAEPSFVTIAFMVLVNAYALLTSTKKIWLKVVFMHLLMLWVMASPLVILSFALFVFLKIKFTTKHFVILGCVILGLVILAISFSDYLLQLKGGATLALRFERGIQGGDGSVNQRILVPIITMLDVFEHSLFWGSGLTAKSVIINYSSLGYFENSEEVLGSNALFTGITYLGIFGTIIFIGIMTVFFKLRLRISGLRALGVFIFLSQTGGGFVTPRFWYFYFFILAALFLSESYKAKGDNKGELEIISS